MCGKSIWLRALPVVETRQVWTNQYTVFHSHGMATGTYFKERGSEDCVWVCICVYTSVTDRQVGQLYTSYILSVNFYCRWELGWLKALRCVFHMCALQKELYRSQHPEDAPRSQTSALRDLYICNFGLICIIGYSRAGHSCIASLHMFIYTKRTLLVDLSELFSEG